MGKTYRSVLTLFIAFSASISAHALSLDTVYDNASGLPLFSLLENAKKSIDIEIYEMQDLRIQKALMDALQRKVRVRIVQESQTFGSKCMIFEKVITGDTDECQAQKKFVEQIRSAGGTYQPYPYQVLCNSSDKNRCLEHGKLVIIDREKAWISTGNLNPSNLCDPEGSARRNFSTCNRDFSVVTSDPQIISALTEVLESDLKNKSYDLSKILKSNSAKRVTVSPFSLDPIVQFIRSAKTSIQIENQYLKNTVMNDEIMAAAKRGVNISIVVSSVCSFGPLDPVKDSYAIESWKQTFSAFDRAGIKSRMFTQQIKVGGFNGYLHSKAIIVDGKRAWVGSVNGSTQALSKNREFGVFIDDAVEVSKLSQIIAADFNHPGTEDWKESLECKKDSDGFLPTREN